MKKIRKGKKMLLILLAVVVAITAIVLIVNLINRQSKEPGTPVDKNVVVPLPETTYSDMQVKNVSMTYLNDNDQTKIDLTIDNTSTRKVENEWLDAVLIDANENIIGQMETWIQNLDVGEEYEMEVILPGDLTSTTQIKLIEK